MKLVELMEHINLCPHKVVYYDKDENRSEASFIDDLLAAGYEWCKICKIGPDIILVDAKPDECRVPRNTKGLLF